MLPVRIALLQDQPGAFVRRIGATVYRTPAEWLTRSPGIRGEDGLITLVEGKRINWSFGPGIALYAE